MVVSHYLRLDVLRCQSLPSVYTSVFLNHNPIHHKRYQLIPFLNRLGLFPDALGRTQFIFFLLDNCSFDRVCPMCSGQHKDILQHTLDKCSQAAHLRLLLKYKLNFYNAPATLKINNKYQLYLLATTGQRVFMKVICEYLTDIRMS